MNKKLIACEHSGIKIPLSEGVMACNCGPDVKIKDGGVWVFLCKKAADKSCYYTIEIAELIKSPEALVDWLAHLNEKGWFDAKKFINFFTRLRNENGLYGG